MKQMTKAEFLTLICKLELPEVDEYGTPLSKMPDCPVCRDDELYMISKDEASCYLCTNKFSRVSTENDNLDPSGDSQFVKKGD
jgi:uncharacterized pyridoxamine 5'-phosphate oxidase family protein